MQFLDFSAHDGGHLALGLGLEQRRTVFVARVRTGFVRDPSFRDVTHILYSDF